ncbi:putative multidrug-efflux transporter [Ensifer adhaerens]|nr:putative multidrug-efflux transporter [Ensifer adhaerens]
MAGAFSTLGNAVAMVALPWFVLTLTGSPLWTGIAAAAGVLPVIAGSLFGGGLVDRFGPRWIAFTGDLTSALAVAAVPLLYHLDMLGIGTLVALIAIGAAMDGPASIAAESRHPELARLAGFRLERVKAVDELI